MKNELPAYFKIFFSVFVKNFWKHYWDAPSGAPACSPYIHIFKEICCGGGRGSWGLWHIHFFKEIFLGGGGLWHIHFFKEIFLGGVRGGSGSMTYSSFPRNLSRGFQGFVTNLFFKEIFREGFAGISRVCDTFVFQDEKKKIHWGFAGLWHIRLSK